MAWWLFGSLIPWLEPIQWNMNLDFFYQENINKKNAIAKFNPFFQASMWQTVVLELSHIATSIQVPLLLTWMD